MQTTTLRWLTLAGTIGSIVALLTLVGPGANRAAEAEPTARETGVTELSCEDGARVSVASGSIINNAWNRASAGAGPWRQCLRSRQRDGRQEFGWSWNWPTRDGIYAYPEVLVGRSPWGTLPSNDARFPVALSALRSLRIDYDIESQHQGKKNLALEFWLTDPQVGGGGPSADAIRAELMIWTHASPGMETSGGPRADIVEIDGQRWAVRMQKDWGDVSGGSPHKWSFITYRAMQHSGSAHYDARHILQHAVDRGWIDPGHQIEGVELGNEIVSGSGSTWIRQFDINID